MEFLYAVKEVALVAVPMLIIIFAIHRLATWAGWDFHEEDEY